MIDPKWYQSNAWLEGAWSEQWVRDLPASYWERMLDSVLRNFVTWIPEDRWPAYLDSASGHNQVCEQLFVRLSQASGNFIPWVSERCNLAGLRVLEIGCGSGSCTAALVRAGASVTGLDISDGFLRVNRTRLTELGLEADLRCIEADWLASPETARRHIAPDSAAAGYDMVVCYALLEHLLPDERLTLLGALREALTTNPGSCLVIYETPNRFAPFDWHSTHANFPDVLPDELAQAYLSKRLPEGHSWHATVGSFHTHEGRKAWFRGGRGVSFHEFDIAFGLENISVIQDGYSDRCDYIRHFRPNKDYETALGTVFAGLQPPVPRGFCRPTLDLILKIK